MKRFYLNWKKKKYYAYSIEFTLDELNWKLKIKAWSRSSFKIEWMRSRFVYNFEKRKTLVSFAFWVKIKRE